MKTTVHRYWKYAAIILTLVVAVNQLESARVRKVLKGVYNYNLEVTVVDEDTDAALSSVKIQLPSSSSNDLLPQTAGTIARADGVIGISGVAYEPREWIFGHEGFEESKFTVGRATHGSVRIKLKKSKSNNSVLPTSMNATTTTPNRLICLAAD